MFLKNIQVKLMHGESRSEGKSPEEGSTMGIEGKKRKGVRSSKNWRMKTKRGLPSIGYMYVF